MKKVNKKVLAMAAAAALVFGAQAFADNGVSYDDDTHSKITLDEGTVITGLKGGYIGPDSSDAVTGGQIYSKEEQYKAKLKAIDDTIWEQTKLTTNLTESAALLTERTNAVEQKAGVMYNFLKDSGFGIYTGGKRLALLSMDNPTFNLSSDGSVQFEGTDTKMGKGVKVSVVANGAVVSGNEGLVTGGMVMDAINKATEGIPTDVNVSNKADKDLSNLSEGGVSKITKLAGDAANAAVGNKADVDGNNIDISSWQKKLATNTVEENNTGLVTSGLLYDAMVGLDGEYAYKDATNMTDANVVAWQEKLSIAKKDASNIDKSAWQTALGDGVNEAGNTGLINGDTLNKALANVSGGKTYVGSDSIAISDAGEITVKANGKVEENNNGLVSGGQVQEAIKKATENIASDATVAAKADKSYVDTELSKKADKSTVDAALANKVDKTEFNTVKDQVNKNTADIATKADKSYVDKELSKKADADKVYTREETDYKINDAISGVNANVATKADKSYVDAELSKKADKDTVTNLEGRVDKQNTAIAGLKDGTGIDVDGYSNVLGVGQVAEGNTGLVNGDAVYGALNELKGNTGIGLVTISDNTVTVAKDSDVTKVNFAGANGNRVLTGVETDVSDMSSAANVGYVNAQAKALEAGMNAMGAKLTNEVKNAGAVGAALAGLHHLDYDPDNKLDVAASVGHYRGKSAGAIGFFYRPNENVMISAGATLGADDNAYNAGLSFKLGKGSSYGSTSKAAMAAEIRQLKQDKDAQAEEIQELKAQVAFLMQKMELSDTVTKSIAK